MIQVKNVVKSFDGKQILRGTSLHVKKGNIYGLVGPNGAGKTTIIRHITGIYKENAGEILIKGEPIWENVRMKQSIAYIPDDIFFFTGATLKEMRKFYKALYPNFDDELFEKLEPFFPKVDKRRKIKTYSKGMQKQMAFWLSIACKPEILILDEPVDGLDPVMRKQVWSILMKEVADRQLTVLVSSHNLRELEDVCDHVGIMSEGSVILERSLEELQENTLKIQMAFDGEEPDFADVQDVIHKSRSGRVLTLIVKGNAAQITAQIEAKKPLFYDLLPLTLEEIFIYELGGKNYEVKDILL
ncbi:MAG: ABC transporter ATP-binding protein [Lachnospiraceae bacterium]|jgi:ABC-2 type transport system ATP-binding protein|nr:ABC transporter ATP-binding protein [Lachnospiraceae bacterium]